MEEEEEKLGQGAGIVAELDLVSIENKCRRVAGKRGAGVVHK